MKTAAQVAKQAQNLGKQLQAVLDVAIYLEELGDLEQTIEEAKRWITGAHDLRAEAEKDLLAATRALATAQQLVEAETTAANRAKTEAKLRSEGIIAGARKVAAETVAAANATADKCLAEMTLSLRPLEKKRDAVAGKTAELETKYAILERGFRELREKTRGIDDG